MFDYFNNYQEVTFFQPIVSDKYIDQLCHCLNKGLLVDNDYKQVDLSPYKNYQ